MNITINQSGNWGDVPSSDQIINKTKSDAREIVVAIGKSVFCHCCVHFICTLMLINVNYY